MLGYTNKSPLLSLALIAGVVFFVAGVARSAPPEGGIPAEKWNDLLDRESLEQWKECDFAGGGEIELEQGLLRIGTGVDLTGVKLSEKLPKIDYEVRLEAKRVQGSDFFVGLTFPVKDDSCSLILGGWGGGVVGLSSLDGFDASENDTTIYREFKNGQWYDVRLQVTAERILCWLDGKQIINAPLEGKKISIRREVEPCVPFGLATWITTAEIRNLKIRKLEQE